MEPGRNPYYSSQVGEPAGKNYEAHAQQLTPCQPTPGMHSVQMSTSNPQIQYTRGMNNFQTPGLIPVTHVTVTSPPRNSRSLVCEICIDFQ
ncbi:hypothetical protein HCN44_000025 [Aphidius gifuensis]|uniref:Uncharacterized protein n=1 Tax=Aphidius gifuensis TaxID=684658 RepID=A0A834XR73_APHGI|nr:hypothetical protein HCN44_000025 [Aphidius gifuensis]